MTHCNCQAESFSISDSPARRQWLIATAGVGGALAMTATTRLRHQRISLAQAGTTGRCRHLHPPRLLALQGIRGRRGIDGRRLARRLSLPLPRFNLRFRRAGVQKQAGPNQPGNPAPHFSDRCAIDYWQRRKGCRLKSGPGSKLKTIERKICANRHHSSKSKSARSLPD